METYSDFWVRLELFYLLGKTKLKRNGKNAEGDDDKWYKQQMKAKGTVRCKSHEILWKEVRALGSLKLH